MKGPAMNAKVPSTTNPALSQVRPIRIERRVITKRLKKDHGTPATTSIGQNLDGGDVSASFSVVGRGSSARSTAPTRNPMTSAAKTNGRTTATLRDGRAIIIWPQSPDPLAW